MLPQCTIAFIVSCFLISCHSNNGEHAVLKRVSNNRNKEAVIFINEGNATVDHSIHLSISADDDKITDADIGNTFVADGDHSAVSLDENAINVVWLSSDTMQIQYDKRLRIFAKKSAVKGVVVIYKEQ